MPITKQDKQELAQIHSDWSERYGGCKEDYFACLYLKAKFRCDIPELAPHIAFGGNDYGLDAYCIDREAKNLYLYQFKWSENHNLFKDSLDRLAKDGMHRIFGNAMADPCANELLNTLRAELQEYKSVIKHVLVHFVFKGDVDQAEESEGLRSRKENLENKIHLVHEYFGDPDVEASLLDSHAIKDLFGLAPLFFVFVFVRNGRQQNGPGEFGPGGDILQRRAVQGVGFGF